MPATVLPILSMAPSPSYKKLFIATQAGTLHSAVLDVDTEPAAGGSGVAKPPADIDIDKVCAL